MTRSITWWGHATCTVQLDDVRILTDPVLTHRVAHLVRTGRVDPPPEAARADAVIVSHLHPDHLHLPSLRRLDPAVRLVVPVGGAAVVRGHVPARTIVEVRAGDQVDVGPVTVRAVPAAHDGRRLPGSRHVGPALGFVVVAGTASVWFAGDTGLFDGMNELGPVDTAIVPVGGWGPTLGEEHLDPARAAQAVRRVGARQAVPVHYGTLWPLGLRRLAPGQFQRRCRAPGAQFAEMMGAAAMGGGVRVDVLQPGESAGIG